MNISVSIILSEQEEAAVRQLIQTCQQFDGTAKTPYLSNQLNFDLTIPTFFLAYQSENLVGVLVVYADTPEVDLSLYVAPDYRRQGIAKALYERFLQEMQKFPLEKVTFVTERAFLQQHSTIASHWLVKESDDNETYLVRNQQDLPELLANGCYVRKAIEDDLVAIATLQTAAFNNNYELNEQYAQVAFVSELTDLFVCIVNGEVVASCTVDKSGDYLYLYGLAVLPTVQKQGIGRYLISQVLQLCSHEESRSFQISVENSNVVAKHLYEKLGFQFQTEIVYLEPIK